MGEEDDDQLSDHEQQDKDEEIDDQGSDSEIEETNGGKTTLKLFE